MKVFPLLSMEYDNLKSAIFGMDTCEAVSLAMISSEIRKMVRMRDLGDVKIDTLYCCGRCTIEIQYKDGTSSKMLLYHCKSFPVTKSVSYKIGGYRFKISKTRNTCVIYTGEFYREASIMLLEHLLTMFKSSKVYLNTKYLTEELLRLLMTCEAFNYVHRLSVHGSGSERDSFPKMFIETLTSPRSRLLSPEYRPVISENRFRTESSEAWIEDLHARDCPQIETAISLNPYVSNLFKSAIRSWKQGTIPIYQDIKIRCSFEYLMQYSQQLSIIEGFENLKCWDANGKKDIFNRKRGFRLMFGYDFELCNDICASYFLYTDGGSDKLYMEFVIWKPAITN